MDSTVMSSSSTTVAAASSVWQLSAEDFDHIAISRDLIVEKRSVHVQRRRNASRNPVKSLILRKDLCRDEYEEVDTGVAEREVQRIKLEQLAKGQSHLAVEALAGLAAKENFAAVALKSAKEAGAAEQPKTPFLLQIKGRRHVQTRLMEPVPSSVNSGDCYLLITPADVIQWVGRYSNVIERAKCSEVAQRILLKKDLGSGRVKQAQLIEEEKVSGSGGVLFGPSKRFWQALGWTQETHPEVNPAGPPEEDELYEEAIVGTNTAWELSGDQLIPCEPCWGSLLQVDMLDPNKVIVFDFGSEMYVWSGKFAALEDRKKASELAQDLWDAGYDYNECAVNPVYQRTTPPEESKSSTRPVWALLKSAKQHMEPVLFREKFIDWPDKTQLIKIKRSESEETTTSSQPSAPNSPPPALQPSDAQAMIENQLEDPDLELEGTHLGRGVEYYDEAERRLHKVSTLSVKVWHVMDYEKVPLDEVSHGQFHARDTYIIRWQYRVTVTGRDLKGQPSVHGLLGRDRFCYFIWQGAQAPPTDLGASALSTVELDEERGPHVRLEQSSEPPAFLALFQGRMAVHSGKRNEQPGGPEWRLYFVRGEKPEEGHLLEMERGGARVLRSRGSLILINTSTGTVYLWHGAKSLKHTRQVALVAATALKDRRPPEFGFQADVSVTIKDQYEGAECREFWLGLGHDSRVADRSLYLSLAESKSSSAAFDFTPRLFHLTSWTGQFRAEEVAPITRCPELPCPYPFLQEVLYKSNQPTLFLLDNGDEVWLWQGWWPEQLPENTENTTTGSSKLRWAAERRCALETVLDYCRYKQANEEDPPPAAHLISAGVEPLAFTCLFPEWTVDDRVAQLSSQEGRKAGEMQSVREVLDRLRRATYSLRELQVRPLPEQMILEGVDPTRLESYLTPEDFQATLGMTKTDFYSLPAWRQSQLRKETGLF